MSFSYKMGAYFRDEGYLRNCEIRQTAGGQKKHQIIFLRIF